eukprot:jgi/Psemu1/60795/gm1.60795_g
MLYLATFILILPIDLYYQSSDSDCISHQLTLSYGNNDKAHDDNDGDENQSANIKMNARH